MKKNSPTSSPKSYATLKQELDSILSWFEGEQFDLDQAQLKYQRAVAIIEELQKRLNTIKLKVDKVKVET